VGSVCGDGARRAASAKRGWLRLISFDSDLSSVSSDSFTMITDSCNRREERKQGRRRRAWTRFTTARVLRETCSEDDLYISNRQL
jgi:hypothetical protein